MEQKPPYLPPQKKTMMKSREEKNAPFSILDLGGGGRSGLGVPFKKSEIAISDGITWNRPPPPKKKSMMKSCEEKNAPFSICVESMETCGLLVPRNPQFIIRSTHDPGGSQINNR